MIVTTCQGDVEMLAVYMCRLYGFYLRCYVLWCSIRYLLYSHSALTYGPRWSKCIGISLYFTGCIQLFGRRNFEKQVSGAIGWQSRCRREAMRQASLRRKFAPPKVFSSKQRGRELLLTRCEKRCTCTSKWPNLAYDVAFPLVSVTEMMQISQASFLPGQLVFVLFSLTCSVAFDSADAWTVTCVFSSCSFGLIDRAVFWCETQVIPKLFG